MSNTGPHGVLARLGALDPARHDPDRRASAQDVTLHHIMDSPQEALPGDFTPRRRSGPMVAASVLVTLVLAVGTVVWNLSGTPVYATWTEQPEQMSAEDTRAVQQHCPLVAHEIVGDVDDPEVREVPLEPALIDVRGDYTYVISVDEQGRYAECFLTRNDQTDVVTFDAGIGPEAEIVRTAPDQGVHILHAGTASWSEGADGLPGALTSAFGRSADDVTEVVLQTDSGVQVHATVQDGWWAAWAPGDDTFVGEVMVVTDDGATHEQDLMQGGR